jgi:hypothetical protein
MFYGNPTAYLEEEGMVTNLSRQFRYRFRFDPNNYCIKNSVTGFPGTVEYRLSHHWKLRKFSVNKTTDIGVLLINVLSCNIQAAE